MRNFSKVERRIEACEYMLQIQIRKQLFNSLIQWVKVAYAQELGLKTEEKKQNSLNMLTNSQNNFTRSHIRSLISQSIYSESTQQ